ncbi:MAG TPA: PQQ-binding-like beta-propeller repeat protein, partial [Vicinamibacterales bacterium]|nr:PQQ-binding-like beta-propeller repeat protein [Vicinamibacterales bacterium]
APAGTLDEQDLSQGPGPHVTPLLAGDLVCAAGVTARLRCLDQTTGRVRWTHDLVREFGATVVFRGYSSSPAAVGDFVIVQAGGKTHSVIAFDAATGRVRWHGGTHANGNSSPVVVRDADGGPQLVAFLAEVVAAYDLGTGVELWTHPHPQRFNDSIAPPLVVDGDVVVSSALDGGTRRLGLSRSRGAPNRQRWHQPRLAVYYTNLAAAGGMILSSTGGLGPTFFTAVDATTGDVLWQTRDLKRSNFVVSGSRLVMRDEDGALVLASVSRTGITEHARASVFAEGAPSPPTLVGTTLYARDRERIAAFSLAAPE